MKAFYSFTLACFLFTLLGCARKNASRPSTSDRLFIAMPESRVEHKNYAPEIYAALWNQFRRAGYRLVDQQAEAEQILKVLNVSIDVPYKSISPDLVLYGRTLRCQLKCLLEKSDGKRENDFVSVALLGSPKKSMLFGHYQDFELHKLFARLAVKIERWLRLSRSPMDDNT